jgi:hypothetical protein
VQLQSEAEVRRRLDDAHERARLGRLELDRDAAAVVPVEDETLRLLELADDCAALVAVAPAEDSLASRACVELDVGCEPHLEPLWIRQRLPDHVRLHGYEDLPFDLHLRNLLVAY